MAEVRLNRLCKDFDLGLNTIVDFLNKNGFYVELNPNAKVDSMCIPLLKEHFGIPAKEDVPKDVPNNFPIIGSKYNNNPFGKKILLLDGFYDEVSSSVLEGYKAGLQTFSDRNDRILMLYGISRTFCQIYDDLNNELDFIDCCTFYSCDCSLVAQSEFKERQRIYAIIDACKPDVVFMLSEDLSTLFHMDLGIEYYGHMYATRNKTPNGHVSDFISVINPLWLDERDIKLFFMDIKLVMRENDAPAERKDGTYDIPDDIFSRPDKTQQVFITAPMREEVKKDLQIFKEFIKYVSSQSEVQYTRNDVKIFLRILTGYPFETGDRKLRWSSRNARVLFYIVKHLYGRSSGKYDALCSEVEYFPKEPGWITEYKEAKKINAKMNIKGNHFDEQHMKKYSQIISRLNTLYEGIYKL